MTSGSSRCTPHSNAATTDKTGAKPDGFNLDQNIAR
jgi:hypothetical protein